MPWRPCCAWCCWRRCWSLRWRACSAACRSARHCCARSSARLYGQDRALSIRRDSWGFALSLVATATLYGAYAWIALSTVYGGITLGQMTMYLLLFRQGQAAVAAMLAAIGGMYEDNLYLC